jgi:hypothetical protein
MRFLVLASACCAGLLLGFLGLVGAVADSSLPVRAWSLILLASTGLALGGLELVLAGGARAIARVLPGRLSRSAALALGATLLLTPVFGQLAAAAFSGRYARSLPARSAWIVGLAGAMVAFAFLALRWLVGRASSTEWQANGGARRPCYLTILILVVLAVSSAAADRLVLVRRYAFFHDVLIAVAFLCLQGAAGALLLAAGRRTRLYAAPALAIVGLAGMVLASRLSAPEHSGLRQTLAGGGAFNVRVLDLCLRLPIASRQHSPSETFSTPEAPATRFASSSGAVHARADVVLITVDALRADHLGLYGYQRPTSPFLDELARRAVVFDRAYAPTPHTSFSLVSLLTGRYAFPLIRAGRMDQQPTLADAFRTSGYRTIGVFPPAVFFVERERFASLERRKLGFEEVHYQSIEESRDARVRTDEAIGMLAKDRVRPVFLWVHYFGPHEPYVAESEPGSTAFGRRDLDRYDDEIRRVDREIGRLLAYLERARPGAVVAVTADHGEEFGDHGGAYHGTSLFDEQSRVPLLLAVPGLAPGRVATAVSTIDLLPTFVGLTDLPWAAPMDGATLVGLTSAAAAPPRTAFAELEGLKMAVVGRYKLLCDMSRDFCQLFDLVADPAERRDLSLRLPGIRAPMLATLRRWAGRPIPDIGNGTAPPSGQATLIERASRGETAALTAVAESLRTQADRQHMPVVDRRLAIQLLATQQPPSNLDLLELVAGDDPDWLVRAWAMVGTVVGGRTRRAAQLADLEVPDEQRHLLAFRALALTAIASPLGPPQTVGALGLIEDSHLRCRLLKTLAASRHPLALPQLRQTYPDVRTRLCVAQALSEVRSAETTAFVRERLKDEPYTTVRAALARALGRSGSPEAVAVLRALFRDETEQVVLTSAARALVDLGLGQRLSGDRELKVPRRARELWVVPRGQEGQPVHVQVDGRRQPQVATCIDRSTPREAYAFALPSVRRHRSLRVFPSRGHALFR